MTRTDSTSSAPRGSGNRARFTAAAILVLVGFAVLTVAVSRRGERPDRVTDSTVSTTSTPAPDTSTDDTVPVPEASQWPVGFQGRPPGLGLTGEPAPESPSDGSGGVHAWSDFDGWFVWSVGQERARTVVTVETDGEIPSQGIRVTGPATVEQPEPTRLVITLEADGPPIAGVRFNPGFFTRRVAISTDRPAEPLLVGWESTPTAQPLTVEMGAPLAVGEPG